MTDTLYINYLLELVDLPGRIFFLFTNYIVWIDIFILHVKRSILSLINKGLDAERFFNASLYILVTKCYKQARGDFRIKVEV